MSKVRVHIAISADGYVAGPNQSEENPLGDGGEQIHDWMLALKAWREPHGREGGEVNTSSAALEQAKEAAGEQDVYIGGGASIINQYLAAGLVDEIEVHVSPLILGGGERLFDGVGPDLKLEQLRAVEAPGVAHLKYRVVKK